MPDNHFNADSENLIASRSSTNSSEFSANELMLPRYMLALQAAGLGVWEFDFITQKLTWDDRMYELFGVKRAEMPDPTASWRYFVHPEDSARLDQALQNMMQGAGSMAVEFRIAWKDHSVHYLKTYTEIMPSLDGQPQRMIGASYDITEQKVAEISLVKSANRYKLLTESMKDVVWTLDPETLHFTYVSPSVFGLRGLTPEEVMAEPMDAAIDETGQARVRELIRSRMAKLKENPDLQKEYFIEQVLQPHKNGSLIWTEVITNYAINPETNKVEIRGVTRDISQRKKIEQSLQESSEQYHFLTQTTVDGYALVDSQGHVKDVNQAYCQMTGFSRDELLSMSMFGPSADAARGEKIGNIQAIKQQGYAHFESQLYAKDGRSIDVDISTSYLPSQDSFLVFIHDISDRKQGELLIRHHLIELEVLYEIGLAINRLLEPRQVSQVVLDILSQKMNWHHATIRSLNQADGKMELLALNEPGLDPVDREVRFQQLNQVIRRIGDGFSGWVALHGESVRCPQVNNDSRYASTYPGIQSGLYAPIRTINQILGTISIESEFENAFNEEDERLLTTIASQVAASFENSELYSLAQQELAERKKAEAELQTTLAGLELRVAERTAALLESETRLRQSRDELSAANIELEKAARLKDEFLASMSHELRTPLTGILGGSEALRSLSFGDLNDRQKKTVQDIETSGRQLLQMVNEILDLTKIEAGKMELQYEYCSLADLCQESLRLVKNSLHSKRQSVAFSINPVVLNLRADPRRLKQMIVNLLNNAIQFTPEDGSLGLEVIGQISEKEVHINVWDSGEGITAEDLPQIFQPFAQLDGSPTRQQLGSGLGLALVKRMAELQGGNLTVKSVPGKGSQFSISLPWKIHDTQPVQYANLNLAINTAMTIETNEIEADHISRALREVRVRNIVQPDPTRAVETAAINEPDVILLELYYPDHHGLLILQQLKADPRTSSIPVILMSVEERRQVALQEGAADFLVKPFTHYELRDVLERISAGIMPMKAKQEAGRRNESSLIFLVDDNPIVLETMADYLESQHFKTERAINGHELLQKGPDLHPDLILMDIQMPDFDGVETTHSIRSHLDKRFAATPIIAVTALAMPGDRERCLNAGMNDYLVKPIRLADLAARVRELLLTSKMN